MMNHHYLRVVTLVIMTTISGLITAKSVCAPKGYIFGVSFSFNSDEVYFTEIQPLDNAYIDDKTKCLLNWDAYTNQLKSHFNDSGESNRTCVTYYSTSFSKIKKTYDKLKKRYIRPKKKKDVSPYSIHEIGIQEFHFTLVQPDLSGDHSVSKEELRAQKKAAKKSKKQLSKDPIQEVGMPNP